jgi:anti-sigma factor RsiW
MNCRDIKPLLYAERDGALISDQRAALDQHVAACPACQQAREAIARAMDTFRAGAVSGTVPDADEEWQRLRPQLSARPHKSRTKIKLAPVIWIGGSLAAAAAVVFAFVGLRPPAKTSATPIAPPPEVAQAEYVEPGDAKASTMVYVDKDSGWLVVWATDADTTTKG